MAPLVGSVTFTSLLIAKTSPLPNVWFAGGTIGNSISRISAFCTILDFIRVARSDLISIGVFPVATTSIPSTSAIFPSALTLTVSSKISAPSPPAPFTNAHIGREIVKTSPLPTL